MEWDQRRKEDSSVIVILLLTTHNVESKATGSILGDRISKVEKELWEGVEGKKLQGHHEPQRHNFFHQLYVQIHRNNWIPSDNGTVPVCTCLHSKGHRSNLERKEMREREKAIIEKLCKYMLYTIFMINSLRHWRENQIPELLSLSFRKKTWKVRLLDLVSAHQSKTNKCNFMEFIWKVT